MSDEQTERHVAPVVVVNDRRFTVSNVVNLTLSTGGLFSPDLYKVKYTKDDADAVFKVKGFWCSSRCLLLDADGKTLVTMKPKACSCHRTWEVFEGDQSTNPKDLLFTVRKSKIFTVCNDDNFDVVLPINTTDRSAPCDFKITGSSNNRIISNGKTGAKIAQMDGTTKWCARDGLKITVYSNNDFAFIVSLIVILEKIKKSRRLRNRSFLLFNVVKTVACIASGGSCAGADD